MSKAQPDDVALAGTACEIRHEDVGEGLGDPLFVRAQHLIGGTGRRWRVSVDDIILPAMVHARVRATDYASF